jgi:hypothetical protein
VQSLWLSPIWLQNSEGEEKKIMYGISIWAIGETNITALKMSNLGRIR